MYHLRRLTIAAGSIGTIVFLLWLLPQLIIPTPPTPEEKRRNEAWVDTSPYWLDRQACRWLGVCGVHHLRWDPPALSNNTNDDDGHELRRNIELRSLFTRSDSHKWLARESLGDESWEIAAGAEASAQQQPRQPVRRDPTQPMPRQKSKKTKKSTEVPSYVLDHAPLVHLFSGENFWPAHIDEHLRHMIPHTNGSAIDVPADDPLTLNNLYQRLNNYSTEVFLTSEADVETRPEWLHSHDGIPFPFKDAGRENGGSNSGGNADAKNGHDYEQPEQNFADDTTWYAVDKDHPLRRISDPRKLQARAQGPQDARERMSRQQRSFNSADQEDEQIVIGGDDASLDGAAHGYKPDESGYSRAPAILVMVDKGSGILDAFWFFFYSYNLGQTVLGVRYGNHVGDWEHCMIRFENGVPRALFLSEHEGGQAYAWSALEKFVPAGNGSDADAPKAPERPVIYSAVGSHAMYAVPGTHAYVLPFKMLRDETDKGPLWDPAKHNLAYHYDYVVDRNEEGDIDEDEDGGADETGEEAGEVEAETLVARRVPLPPTTPPDSLTPAASNPDAPTSWFHFRGPWGDELYELGDTRQWRIFQQYHYVTGPRGPKFKNLGREKVCQTQRCRILYSLDAGKKASWYS